MSINTVSWIGTGLTDEEQLAERRQLLADLRRQLPDAKEPLRDQTVRAIKILEDELGETQ